MEYKTKNDLIRDVRRYWVIKENNEIYRKWIPDEYRDHDPHTPIYEKFWSYCCPRCGFIPRICRDKQDSKQSVARHKRYWGDYHKCIIEYKDWELVCYEEHDRYIADRNLWIREYQFYDKESSTYE